MFTEVTRNQLQKYLLNLTNHIRSPEQPNEVRLLSSSFVLMGQPVSDFTKVLLATSEAPFCSSLSGKPAFTAFKQSL